MSALRDWIHKVHQIPRSGLEERRDANEALCRQLAHELGVTAVNHLQASYRLQIAGKGRFSLSGTVNAEVTRQCIVTLDPISEIIAEPLDCTFVPPDALPQHQSEEEEALSLEDLEPIRNDVLDVGRVIFEVLVASLDPYPRTPGAELDEQPRGGAAEEATLEHPFAALARLKQANERDT